MESLAQTKQTWSSLQFPSAPLSALTIPHVSAAMQSGIASLFMRDYGYLVDHLGHSAFCLEAVKGGLVHESDLSPLVHYPNGYGLHLVTDKVVKSIESQIGFTINSVPDAERIIAELNRVDVEISYAAGIALALAEGGLLHDSDLAPIISLGENAGYDLLKASEKAVDALMPMPLRQERVIEDGTVYINTPFDVSIHGTDLYLSACERNVFYLEWPEFLDVNLEIHILLSMTLGAMSTYLAPFHTPSSAFGLWGQYSHGVSECYEGFCEEIAGKTRDEIVEFFLERDDVVGELEWLGVEQDDDGGPEIDSLINAASMLWQIADVEENFKYSLTYGQGIDDQFPKTEMSELLSQGKELIAKGGRHAKLAEVLCDALEACIARFDTHQNIDQMLIGDSGTDSADPYQEFENSPNRFYDCIWVLAGRRHHELHLDALEAFNADVDECSHLAVQLPLSSGELVAQVTIPIMERTNQCLSLLRQIQLSLEVTPDA